MHGQPPDRRDFLRTSFHFMLLGAGWSCASRGGGGKKPSGQAEGKETRMKLSLSARVAESFSNKEEASLNLAQLIDLARNHGYRALCMRASQAGTHSPREQVNRMSRQIGEAGLTVSMVTGDFAVPRNDELGPSGLRNIAPYLDLAETFGADLIRICMKKEEDIPWAQRASDHRRRAGHPPGPPVPLRQPLRDGGKLPPGAAEGGPAQLRDHLRTRQLDDRGRRLRPGDHQEAGTSPLQRLRPEPPPQSPG